MSEYGEPWHIDPDKLYLNSLCQSNGNYVAIDAGGARDAERIVACVNALSGIPNPEAVRELIAAVREWTDVERCVTDERIFKALAALSAPSTGAQQQSKEKP